LQHVIPYISLLGLFLPLLILFYNKGFKSANRYLAGFLFFSSLYLLESFTFFYAESKSWVAFFTNTHTFYYLIGPFAFFYVKSMLRDDSKLSKFDLVHFLLFAIAFIGFLPYLFASWSYKLIVAENIQSESWDMAKFHLNIIIPHKVDQGLNVLHIYFYSASLWYLIWKYKRSSSSRIYKVPQFKLIRNWLFIFTLIITIITLNFTVAMANMWIYDDKSTFLQKASGALLFASIVYVGMNMIVMIFPHIMYGLPLEVKESILANGYKEIQTLNDQAQVVLKSEIPEETEQADTAEKKESNFLFSSDYIEQIEAAVNEVIKNENYLVHDFKLSNISSISGLPAHHLTYYFNSILELSFSDWRNILRIKYAIQLLKDGNLNHLTLEAISSQIGFTSQSTFIRAFKLHTGNTPSEYIKTLVS
jgi:AraC-like DNA-binding protein